MGLVGVVVALWVVLVGCASTVRGSVDTSAAPATGAGTAQPGDTIRPGAGTGQPPAGTAQPGDTSQPPKGTAQPPAAPAAPKATAPATCPHWSAATVTGSGSAALVEVSGLAAGHRNPDLLWAHNDSGDSARVFAIDQSGEVVTEVTVAGAGSLDWEDIAIGPGPDGQPWIWVADVGDNFHLRPHGSIYRFPEPDLGASPPARLTVQAERTDVSYPDGRTNIESLMVDSVSGDGFLVGKDVDADQTVPVYRLAADRLIDGGRLEAEVVARVVGRTDQRDGPTAADMAPDGTLVLVSNGRHGFLWPRDPAVAVGQVLAAAPTAPCEAPIGGGEAVTFSLDGRHLWAMNEGANPKLRRYDRADG